MADIFFTQPDWQLFTNINTLPQQAGVAKYLLPKLVAKELCDNALDVDGKVEIEQETDDNYTTTIRIRNFGKAFGGSNEEIAAFFSIKRPLTSSKRFRLPSRGALGNGLRVVTATIYCLKGTLTLATNGRKLQLIPQDDGTTDYEVIGEFKEEGTEVCITIPDNIFGETTLEWANLALKMNRGENYSGKTNPYWYDSDSFYNLILTLPKNIDFQDFLSRFDGCNLAKAALIHQKINSDIFQLKREEADIILEDLRNLSKEINPKKLGATEILEGFDTYHKEFAFFELKTTKGKFDANIPVVVEVFARLKSQHPTQFFVNKTPITGEVGVLFYEKKMNIFGCGLNTVIDIQKLKQQPEIWLNIITPYMPIVSNGKEPDLSVLEEPIAKTLKNALSQLKKHSVLQEKMELIGDDMEKIPSQKEVVIQNLAAAMAKASGNGQYRYSLRQLYYALRPFVFGQTGKELKYANFNTIITDYEYETGKDVEGIYRDERGTLLHPHTHEEIKLGTKNIEKYQRPLFNFNKIVYSEKEGFFEILKDVGFCEKHDCALLTSKGFASRAARDVIDLLAETEEELIFFCIHDADLSGTLIYQALQGATKARPERKVKIINLGIEAWEGLEMELEVESLEKVSKKNPAQYVLDYEEEEGNKRPFQYAEKYYQNDWANWLRSYRIELNAMDTPTFVEWLDRKVSQYDNGKVIPDEVFLQKEAVLNLELSLKNKIKEEILQNLNIESLISKQFAALFPTLRDKLGDMDFQPLLEKDLKDSPQQSWLTAFQEILVNWMEEKQK